MSCAEEPESLNVISPLRLAKTTVLLRLPVIRPNSRNGIEQVVRVVLVLDAFKPWVILTIENRFPVLLLKVSFVKVSAPVRSQLGELWNQNISHQVLVRKHILPRRGEVPRRGDDGVDEVVAPPWADSIIGEAGSRERGVGCDSDELGALLVDEAVCGCEGCVVVFD